MTFEKILNDVSKEKMSLADAYQEVSKPDMRKKINYYSHVLDMAKDPLKEGQLQELKAIVEILQILYNSNVDSPVSDSTYDSLQETLIDMGIPRLTGTIEINDAKKVSGKFRNLRGTLDKTYYLFPDEVRTNKSRKYLDEWIKSTEALYRKNTGKDIDLNKVKIMLQPKFDGASATLEWDEKPLWITRGDTRNNRASDVSHIMNIFNDVYSNYGSSGHKFEVMITEEGKDKINQFYREKPYHNSRQIVTSILNSNEPDFKSDYLYPVPLRIMYPGDDVEQIHPELIKKFPTKVCTFGDRDVIKEFANQNRYVNINGQRLRTDGAVMTILDDDIKRALGRENNINNFEVAYKFTEEIAYTKVKKVEFYTSDFGFITPVLVVNDVILKGNTVNHISLSNRERFDELGLCYGDEVKVLYDIIPYVTVDDKCQRVPHGRKIEFTKTCPMCHETLDLTKTMVQCTNPSCPSRVIGRILNYCSKLRIQNIGYQTLDVLYAAGFLKHGIRDLYKLKKKDFLIQDLEGFGKLKTRKIISEIESKRKLKDYEFFGSIGIEGLSIRTFQAIFSKLSLTEMMELVKLRNYDLLKAKLLTINGIGNTTANDLVSYLKDSKNQKELDKLLEEVRLEETYTTNSIKRKRIVFSGCRPTTEVSDLLDAVGYDASDSWSNDSVMLVIPTSDFTSSKVAKAKTKDVPIIALNGEDQKTVIQRMLGGLKLQ